MTTILTTHTPGRATDDRARAYCGPAHGHTWLRTDAESWPPRVLLDSPFGPQEYRLVHDPRAHRPARDHDGNTLYLPTFRAADGAGWGTST